MCGYKCDLCKAFATNIINKDEREILSNMWKKYYDLDIPPEEIYCDGCRCNKENAKRIDDDCPVRKCVIDKKIDNCGECIDIVPEASVTLDGQSHKLAGDGNGPIDAFSRALASTSRPANRGPKTAGPRIAPNTEPNST